MWPKRKLGLEGRSRPAGQGGARWSTAVIRPIPRLTVNADVGLGWRVEVKLDTRPSWSYHGWQRKQQPGRPGTWLRRPEEREDSTQIYPLSPSASRVSNPNPDVPFQKGGRGGVHLRHSPLLRKEDVNVIASYLDDHIRLKVLFF